jgi:hypothetical protein
MAEVRNFKINVIQLKSLLLETMYRNGSVNWGLIVVLQFLLFVRTRLKYLNHLYLGLLLLCRCVGVSEFKSCVGIIEHLKFQSSS